MARVYSPLAGKVRGRVGSTIFRNGQRATVAAQYNPQVANPKTAAQAIQRAAFATATTAQAAMLDIVDHSHEKLSSRRENLQRFVQQNAEMVRAGILTDYNGGWTNVFPTLKGAHSINIAPYIVSEGSLLFPRTKMYNVGSRFLAGIKVSAAPAETISTQQEYETALALIGLLPGDQLSLVGIIEDTETKIASVTINDIEYPQYACEVQKARVTFVNTIPEGFSGPLILNDYINPALVAKSEGAMIVQFGQVEGEQAFMATFPTASDPYELAAAVLIRSQESTSKVLYSNGRMAVITEPEGDIAWPRAQSYMDGVSVRIGDQPFLDNPLLTTSTSQVASTSVDAGALPLVTTQGESYSVDFPLPEAPTAVVLTAQAVGGDTKQTANAVGKADGAVLASWPETGSFAAGNLIINGDNQYADGRYTLTFESSSGRAIIVSGGYAIAGGKRYTF